ncbi:MAG TPA: hypothetical protein VJC01_00120 [Candidatus Paceibacterota bacterium]
MTENNLKAHKEEKTGKREIENEDIKNLIISRLEMLPPDFSLSLGSDGSFSKKELITHIEDEDEIGEKVVEIQMEYLRMLKEGLVAK